MQEIPKKFLSGYNPDEYEDKIYKKWEDSGFFNPDNLNLDKDAETFSIVLPPPNVTGELHLGHASMLAIEDIMVRYNRMLGKDTLWLPGTDHAAIATQSKVEKELSKEKIRKHDLGREKFLEKVNEYAKNSHATITSQIKKMGASVDWSREAFTLDKDREIAVRTAFEKMYSDGLIYRKNKVINWDPKGQTVISDDEVIYKENKGKLYYFKYSTEFPITIATTRPETKFGDTGIAVNPNDSRYSKYIGQTISVKFIDVDLNIKIFADKNVDPEFGTGAVGVTPAHSFTDYEMGIQNDLEIIPVINEYAKMSVDSDLVKDKKTTEARELIVKYLEENNLLEKTEEIDQNIATAERTGGIIEPLPKLQWFINVNKEFTLEKSNLNNIKAGEKTTLKKLMLSVVNNPENDSNKNQIEIMPERFGRVYMNWINNLNDWCISRQIWYGHQIPVWYKGEEIFVGINAPEESGWEQDPDTLDTWFSSGLWTFSTLGWPDETSDFKKYHPTTVLETGYDIIFFWVARMILMSTYLLGDIPFEKVYLHGLVRDAKGQKMSKSLGNGIDPVEVSNKYGADAVRMSLIVGVGPGNDLNLSEDKIKAYKKFSNKIWNATRFVLENVEIENLKLEIELDKKHQEIINQKNDFIKEITKEMNEYKFYLTSEKIYHYFWHTFADIIIENSKQDLESGNEELIISTQKMLYTILVDLIKILHPYMPFVTEEIWQDLPIKDSELLMVENWPNLKK